MTRSIRSRVAAGILATGAATAFALAGASAANAGPLTGQYLTPNGGQVCSNAQFAGYQVRGMGTATIDSLGNGGAKFKLMKNGQVVAEHRDQGRNLERRAARRLRKLQRARELPAVRREHRQFVHLRDGAAVHRQRIPLILEIPTPNTYPNSYPNKEKSP